MLRAMWSHITCGGVEGRFGEGLYHLIGWCSLFPFVHPASCYVVVGGKSMDPVKLVRLVPPLDVGDTAGGLALAQGWWQGA